MGSEPRDGAYRVTQDAEGWPMIPGRHGRIEYHDEATLAVYSRAMRKLGPPDRARGSAPSDR
jgi:hypothetical protein